MNKQYEYTMIPYEPAQLNAYGELGWDAYAMIPMNAQYHVCLKRITGVVNDGSTL